MSSGRVPRERPRIGLSLQPDRAFLQHNRRLVEADAELFEVTPETIWRAGAEPGLGYDAILGIVRRLGRPVVGHGVLFGLGNAEPPPRRADWLRGLRRDREAFGFAWLSEHLGFADGGGLHGAFPLPLPATEAGVDAAVANLRALQTVHPTVLFENNADLFCLGDPLDQPGFFAAICERAGAWLLLDLHNAWAHCSNLGVDVRAWLDRLPWDRVVEIHLSGGSDSDPEWLPSRRVLRLDSHDGAVPEPVWELYATALRRAANLRAVIVEWLPDGFTAEHAAVLAADFARARRLAAEVAC